MSEISRYSVLGFHPVAATCVAVMLWFFSCFAHAAKVEGVRVWRSPDSTRLVFDLSAPVEHKVFPLDNPNRIVVDVAAATFSAETGDLDFTDTPIQKLRYGTHQSKDLRIVLDVAPKTTPRSFFLKKQAGKPDRLVVDLYSGETTVAKVVEQVKPASSSKRDIIVAIDAGHGGEDPGSIGPGRLYEKNVVLSVSRHLANQLNATPGYKAKLIRTGDYYVNNALRRENARRMRADLFISIHADGFKDSRAKGASVFALSQRGATSQMAAMLASKANESDLIGGEGNVSLNDKDDLLAGVLVDLSMTATLASSLDVGSRVLKNMGRFTSLHKNHVEQAAFIVLKSPDVPSILVETGFITNPIEAKKLNNPAHQKQLANAVFSGVTAYFEDNPPADSYVAWAKNKRLNNKAGGASVAQGMIRHKIAEGDTLSGIAKKYRVSVAQIQSVNRLTSTHIKVGQVLTIPAS